MAASIGVRSCRASTPVPEIERRARLLLMAARVEKASGPTVSAVQMDPKPSSAVRRAIESPTSSPSA